MDTEETKREEATQKGVKEQGVFVVYSVLALLGLWLFFAWLSPTFHGWQLRRERNSELAPLFEKARVLGLRYENAATVTGSVGTPVLWCVQNRDEWSVTVDGDPAKRIRVSNYPAMPRFMGDKHNRCSPMLMILEKPVTGEKVRVFFKEAPEIR